MWSPDDAFDILKMGEKKLKCLQGPRQSWERVKLAECVRAGASCLHATQSSSLPLGHPAFLETQPSV